MPEGQPITRELSLSEVISKTFQLYASDFVKYLILFVIIEAIIGVLTTVLQRDIVFPIPPVNATPQETLAWASSFLEASAALVAITGLVTWVFYPIAYGTAVKVTSEQIEKGYADFALSIRAAVSQLLWMWVVGIVVGIVVILGLIALIVPGIILSVMFSLVLPIIIIEKSGFQSLGRSRELVSHRWLKTLILLIVFAIIIGIAAAIVGQISALFGSASMIVSSILSAFYVPLLPIAVTVFYYSNVARIAPPSIAPPSMPPTLGQPEARFCHNCGTQLSPDAKFCPNCGANLSI